MSGTIRGRRKSRVVLVSAILALVSSCATMNSEKRELSLWHPVPADTIPAGTLLTAQLRQAISTEGSHPGDRFTADLLDPVLDGAGNEVFPRGAEVSGVVTKVVHTNMIGSLPSVELHVTKMRPPGGAEFEAPLQIAQSPVELTSITGRTVVGAIGGAAIGAATGVAINSHQSGIVVGSAFIGLGVGALAGLLIGPREAALPAGSVLTLRVMQDFAWTKPVAAAGPQQPAASRP